MRCVEKTFWLFFKNTHQQTFSFREILETEKVGICPFVLENFDKKIGSFYLTQFFLIII